MNVLGLCCEVSEHEDMETASESYFKTYNYNTYKEAVT